MIKWLMALPELWSRALVEFLLLGVVQVHRFLFQKIIFQWSSKKVSKVRLRNRFITSSSECSHSQLRNNRKKTRKTDNWVWFTVCKCSCLIKQEQQTMIYVTRRATSCLWIVCGWSHIYCRIASHVPRESHEDDAQNIQKMCQNPMPQQLIGSM